MPTLTARCADHECSLSVLTRLLTSTACHGFDAQAFVCRILAHNDQQCSLFLQQRVRSTATQEKRQELFDAVGRHVLELSLSKFGALAPPPLALPRLGAAPWCRASGRSGDGTLISTDPPLNSAGNFLVSRCLEAGDSALAQAFEDAVSGHFLQLSVDPFGCHVVQKLLDCGGPATKDKVVAACAVPPQRSSPSPLLTASRADALPSAPQASASPAHPHDQVEPARAQPRLDDAQPARPL